jgi:osmotically-inducible protein OsmY
LCSHSPYFIFNFKNLIMADNNRNWNNQYQQSNDWEQNRNRFEDEDGNRENYRYRNTNYGSDYNQNTGMKGNYGNRQYGDSAKGREMENQGGYGGAYSSDYGNQGENYGQSGWGQQGSRQNWQGSGNNQSQQWRNDDWNKRNEGYGQDWQRRNIEGNYESGRNRNDGGGYGSTGGSYDQGYRNTGYGEGRGMNSGYTNRNYEGDRWQGNYGNDRSDRNRDWWDRTKDEVSSWFGDDDAERRRRVDKINGPHKGKGPRDYRRSEDRIKEDVCDRLADDDYVDASNINVQIQNDEVVLSGTVNSREEKRRAEDVVESISGVRNVENRLRVGRGDMNFDRYTGTTNDAGGVGRESGTTNEIIRNEKNKNR